MTALHRQGREERAWSVLARVADPEIPVLSVVDLGIIRRAEVRSDGVLEVGIVTHLFRLSGR